MITLPKSNALFNLNRLVSESGKDISTEMSFLQDFDYTVRQMNAPVTRYYFQEINQESNPEYFDTSERRSDVVCIDRLPEICDGTYLYSSIHAILHTNDQKYYVCLKSSYKPTRSYKPSSMHCLRQMYYMRTGRDIDTEGAKSGDFFGICESGEDRHIRIQRVISSMRAYGVDCDFISVADYVREHNLDLEIITQKEYETKLHDSKRDITFLCDGIIKYKGEYYIIEIKTESSHKWASRIGVDCSHRYQAYTYSLELGIGMVLFIYENRDVCTKKAYLLNVTDVAHTVLESRLSICESHVQKKTVPAIEGKPTEKICQYCQYRTSCKVDGEDEKAE